MKSRLLTILGRAIYRAFDLETDRLDSSICSCNDRLRLALGEYLATERGGRGLAPGRWNEAEFRVFSQWNEDGLIQHLIRNVLIADTTFVELGVGDYRESNTRFLLHYSGWSGVAFDTGTAHRQFVYEGSDIGWRYPIDARTAFLTKENINDELRKADVHGDIGLLSIDIDGNDYWVWEAITVASPRIVISEFNSTFGCEHSVTVPYSQDFSYRKAHESGLYFGASLPALVYLARSKGYRFVGCESHGANAFFVREDVAQSMPAIGVAAGWVESRFRGSMGGTGLTYVTGHRRRLEIMADLVVEIVPKGVQITIGELFGL